MKQCWQELSFDQQSGRTYLIDSRMGTQRRVNAGGMALIHFRPNLSGIANFKQRGDCAVPSRRVQCYTPRQDKFCGYAQLPNMRLNAQFINDRGRAAQPPDSSRSPSRLILHNNSYNKPNSVEVGLTKPRQKIKNNVNVGESSFEHQGMQYLTASIRDSREVLQTNHVTVLEARSTSTKKQESDPALLHGGQFISRIINGNELHSPRMSIMRRITQLADSSELSLTQQQLRKKHQLANRRHNATLDTVGEVLAHKDKMNCSLQYEDADQAHKMWQYQQLNQSFQGRASFQASENGVTASQLTKIKFYFKRQRLPDFGRQHTEQSAAPRPKRLITMSTHQVIQSKEVALLESYPKIIIKNQRLHQKYFDSPGAY